MEKVIGCAVWFLSLIVVTLLSLCVGVFVWKGFLWVYATFDWVGFIALFPAVFLGLEFWIRSLRGLATASIQKEMQKKVNKG